MPTENKTKKLHETGNAKILESFDRLAAFGATLDSGTLNAPADLTTASLQAAHAQGTSRHTAVGNSKADFRTAALARQTEVDKFDALASQAVAQLVARGASKETAEDARSYVRKLQGRRTKPKAETDPASPNFNPNEKSISASQQSNAAKISTFNEFLDFLEAQSEYAGVKQSGLLVSDLRTIVQNAQTKHTASINSAATLAADRNDRNKFFYTDKDNLCELAARYKNLVKGTYGAGSLEYKTINAIPFRKRAK